MRELTSHKVNGLNDALKIEVLDEPGSGGACHAYDITGFDTAENKASVGLDGYRRSFARVPIVFQNGPIAEAGVNGISNEALLAVVEDRLRSFQAGPYSCRENALALTHLQESMHWLHHRTRERVSRGVEGTSAK
jgi:hypothetical protein